MNNYHPDKYWEKRLSEDFSLGGVGFLGQGIEYNKWLYRARLRALTKLLKKHHIDPCGKRILDIGVGTGFYIDFWKKLGVTCITGLDITQKSISELAVKYPEHNFIKEDISGKVVYLREKFDIITAFDVLFHIVDEDRFEQAIRNIKSLSHSDSWFLISDNFLGEHKPPAFHENDRTLSRYKKALQANGLQIIEIQPIFYFSSTPIDVGSVKSKPLQQLLKVSWKIVCRVLYYANHRKLKKTGGASISFVLGWLLYHIDGVILRCVKIGPSTKLSLAQVKKTNDQS